MMSLKPVIDAQLTWDTLDYWKSRALAAEAARDKLVEAARDAALVLRLYSKETKTGNGDYEAGKLDAILARIQGAE